MEEEEELLPLLFTQRSHGRTAPEHARSVQRIGCEIGKRFAELDRILEQQLGQIEKKLKDDQVAREMTLEHLQKLIAQGGRVEDRWRSTARVVVAVSICAMLIAVAASIAAWMFIKG